MLMSLDCYDETIPYAVSYPSVTRARTLLGITSASIPDQNLSNIASACTGLENKQVLINSTTLSTTLPNGLPNTTMEFDTETGTGGVQLEVVINTEYNGAQTSKPVAGYPGTIGYPNNGHAWPANGTLAQLYNYQGQLPYIWSNQYVKQDGTVITPAQLSGLKPNEEATPVGLTSMVVQFLQKYYNPQ
jgi:hypothetical protein